MPCNALIVALNGAGVIPAEEAQDVGRVLREDRLTATRCKLESRGGRKAKRRWPRSRKLVMLKGKTRKSSGGGSGIDESNDKSGRCMTTRED